MLTFLHSNTVQWISCFSYCREESALLWKVHFTIDNSGKTHVRNRLRYKSPAIRQKRATEQIRARLNRITNAELGQNTMRQETRKNAGLQCKHTGQSVKERRLHRGKNTRETDAKQAGSLTGEPRLEGDSCWRGGE